MKTFVMLALCVMMATTAAATVLTWDQADSFNVYRAVLGENSQFDVLELLANVPGGTFAYDDKEAGDVNSRFKYVATGVYGGIETANSNVLYVGVNHNITFAVNKQELFPGEFIQIRWVDARVSDGGDSLVSGLPSRYDWIGFYAVGDHPGNYVQWMYLNCTQSLPSAPVVNGSCDVQMNGYRNHNQKHNIRFMRDDVTTTPNLRQPLATTRSFLVR